MYVLVGSPGESILPTIYVGEGDPVKNRLNQHYGRKDFWDWAVFFVGLTYVWGGLTARAT